MQEQPTQLLWARGRFQPFAPTAFAGTLKSQVLDGKQVWFKDYAPFRVRVPGFYNGVHYAVSAARARTAALFVIGKRLCADGVASALLVARAKDAVANRCGRAFSISLLEVSFDL